MFLIVPIIGSGSLSSALSLTGDWTYAAYGKTMYFPIIAGTKTLYLGGLTVTGTGYFTCIGVKGDGTEVTIETTTSASYSSYTVQAKTYTVSDYAYLKFIPSSSNFYVQPFANPNAASTQKTEFRVS